MISIVPLMPTTVHSGVNPVTLAIQPPVNAVTPAI
jgi:hypothetical protein